MGRRAEYGAGIVHYGGDPGLASCLASLYAQVHPPVHVVVVDHDPPDSADPARAALRLAHPEVEWIHAPNGGYSAGANRVVSSVLAAAPDCAFVLVLNPDVELEPTFAAAAVDELARHPDVALASGKLLRPGGREIDSAGIARRRSRRYVDRGSESPDDGRFDRVETVFAVSGAALLLRRAALEDLAIEGELFDEDFFTYHEDTDLAWRARQLGWRSLYVPAARAIHVRGWRRSARRRVADGIRRHSFKNRYLELLKNERVSALVRDLPFVLPVELARLGFALAVDRALLRGYLDALRLARRALRKRALLRAKAAGGPVEATSALLRPAPVAPTEALRASRGSAGAGAPAVRSATRAAGGSTFARFGEGS
ncbi:MAG: glycosyltransferase family 2 protein [Myxococcota bacterium]